MANPLSAQDGFGHYPGYKAHAGDPLAHRFVNFLPDESREKLLAFGEKYPVLGMLGFGVETVTWLLPQSMLLGHLLPWAAQGIGMAYTGVVNYMGEKAAKKYEEAFKANKEATEELLNDYEKRTGLNEAEAIEKFAETTEFTKMKFDKDGKMVAATSPDGKVATVTGIKAFRDQLIIAIVREKYEGQFNAAQAVVEWLKLPPAEAKLDLGKEECKLKPYQDRFLESNLNNKGFFKPVPANNSDGTPRLDGNGNPVMQEPPITAQAFSDLLLALSEDKDIIAKRQNGIPAEQYIPEYLKANAAAILGVQFVEPFTDAQEAALEALSNPIMEQLNIIEIGTREPQNPKPTDPQPVKDVLEQQNAQATARRAKLLNSFEEQAKKAQKVKDNALSGKQLDLKTRLQMMVAAQHLLLEAALENLNGSQKQKEIIKASHEKALKNLEETATTLRVEIEDLESTLNSAASEPAPAEEPGANEASAVATPEPAGEIEQTASVSDIQKRLEEVREELAQNNAAKAKLREQLKADLQAVDDDTPIKHETYDQIFKQAQIAKSQLAELSGRSAKYTREPQIKVDQVAGLKETSIGRKLKDTDTVPHKLTEQYGIDNLHRWSFDFDYAYLEDPDNPGQYIQRCMNVICKGPVHSSFEAAQAATTTASLAIKNGVHTLTETGFSLEITSAFSEKDIKEALAEPKSNKARNLKYELVQHLRYEKLLAVGLGGTITHPVQFQQLARNTDPAAIELREAAEQEEQQAFALVMERAGFKGKSLESLKPLERAAVVQKILKLTDAEVESCIERNPKILEGRTMEEARAEMKKFIEHPEAHKPTEIKVALDEAPDEAPKAPKFN